MKNIYHRYLNLPFDIQKPEYCNQQFDMIHQHDLTKRHDGQEGLDYIDRKMTEWFESLNCAIGHTECFYTPPGQIIPIHTDDIPPSQNDIGHVKINMTWGPVEGVVRWWNSNKTVPMKNTQQAAQYLATGVKPPDDFIKDFVEHKDDFSDNRNYEETPFLVAREEDSTLVYEKNTNIPSLCNVGQLHSTYNPTNEGRWTLCFVPCQPTISGHDSVIPWTNALEIFKDYIIED
jgi:hypothetical protein